MTMYASCEWQLLEPHIRRDLVPTLEGLRDGARVPVRPALTRLLANTPFSLQEHGELFVARPVVLLAYPGRTTPLRGWL